MEGALNGKIVYVLAVVGEMRGSASTAAARVYTVYTSTRLRFGSHMSAGHTAAFVVAALEGARRCARRPSLP